ncbi:MAG: hypothetical protein P8168_12750 [Deltaproteobacteria bacterium]|jgi:cytochrome c biogenesis protein CcdA
MGWLVRRRVALIMLLLSFFLGCTVPSSSQTVPLTMTAARNTLDSWNPSFCKVVEFYGFYQSGQNAAQQVAYVLLANPHDKAKKPLVFAARFRLLTLPGGLHQWFLTSLVTHSSGLSRRQGWDNLMIQVKKAPAPAPSK